MKYQVCFHAKNKKKNVIFAPFAAKFFYREMVWNFIGVYSVYNKGTLHDCLEKGNSNSNVILTPSAAKNVLLLKGLVFHWGLQCIQ